MGVAALGEGEVGALGIFRKGEARREHGVARGSFPEPLRAPKLSVLSQRCGHEAGLALDAVER